MAEPPPAVADPLDSLPEPPLDPTYFSDEFMLTENFLSFDDEGFDITFDDINLPSDTEEFLNSTFAVTNPVNLSSSDPDCNDVVSDPESAPGVLSSQSGDLSGDRGSDVAGFLNFSSPGDEETARVSNCSSPESRNGNPVSSQGSGNCGSAGSDGDMNCPSPDSGNSVINQKVKKELGNNFVLKRKKENGDVNSESRTVKCRRSSGTSANTEDNSNQLNEEDEKKKARLIRNRESAQLSRQRKKHYVEELEDKVRAMHSTIQDLNARISYIAAENATLRQQMVIGSSGGAGAGGPVCPPPVVYPPHPAMAPMGYPWTPFPPYLVKPQGSQVPLVPIPRYKPQQPVSSQKAKKVEVKKTERKVEVKKTEGKTKTKKVASVSFLGLLLFIFLFGLLVPMVNVKFGGMRDSGYSGGSSTPRFYDQHHPGRVLMFENHVNGTNHDTGIGGRRGHEQNASEPLVASLYVPRNDKLVKIDGNLIIHSVLASEKAMASRKEQGMTSKKEETGLAVALDLAPAISVPAVGRNNGRHPQMYRTSTERQRALASDNENLKSKGADGKLQQWFREGLAGPMLTSGMCTEVFQFDVSAASASGAMIPASSVGNITAEDHQNSTYISKRKNRRILHGLPIPLPGSANNITKEQVASNDSKHENPNKNSSVSSMVVSVLVDPREAGDGGEADGVMGPKSFSRIFVVVLLDSVKYVTYSCMLPLKGASHLIAT